jgi:3-oxoacyl-[acyl-carrier protein] reductase
MNLSLLHRHAIVGGSSAGIGRAVAIELALLGAHVTLIARTESRLQAVITELDTAQGQQHRYIVGDYAHPTELVRRVADLVVGHPAHILVNNTGGPPPGPIVEASTEAFLLAYQQHLLCNQLLAQTVLPGMKENGYGRIINVISTSVKEPLDQLGVSNTTRWSVAAWAKTWANEVGPFGVTVNNVLPGYTETDRLHDIIARRSAQTETDMSIVQQQLQQHVPLRRFAQPQEVAAAVAFLASPAAAYITGINLPVDGGRTKSL